MSSRLGGHRWAIAIAALKLEEELVRQLARRFHRVPEAVIRDAYADAWERACRPIGELGAFPEDDLRGLPGWLHRSTTQRLLHVARDSAKWISDNPVALEVRFVRGGDPAEILVNREVLARVAGELRQQSADVRAYFVADRLDGVKRHEIRQRTGWSQDKVKHLRSKMTAFVTSNKPFSAWGEIFGDDVVAAAMIDRLVHHAEILALKGDSYRLKDRDLARPAPPAD